VLVAVEERGNTDNHLVDEDAKRPPVDCVVMPISNKHLGCKILGRPAERVGQLTSFLHELGKSEISHQQVPVVANQNIFWFQITVQNVLTVEMA
jgi:hypothetical protein